ncbi:hypothetical protein OH77DRAFT_1433777 [Trametes cingulata]|nr:hypothetical protein OH77DRAFT_1433777 [Trametes cingulata]
MSTSESSRPRYLVRTAEVPISSLRHLVHPMDSTNHRYTFSLGDTTGMTKTGVHFCRLPPGATSTTLHYHTNEDEWYYIIDAGEGGTLITWEPANSQDAAGEERKAEPKEEQVKTGDFIGFKAGLENAPAHALRAGSTEMVYLVGGSREEADNSVYPLLGQRLIIERSEGVLKSWSVEDKNLTPVTIPQPTVLKQ